MFLAWGARGFAVCSKKKYGRVWVDPADPLFLAIKGGGTPFGTFRFGDFASLTNGPSTKVHPSQWYIISQSTVANTHNHCGTEWVLSLSEESLLSGAITSRSDYRVSPPSPRNGQGKEE